jgi:site-specific recombinase XerD
VGKLNNIPNLNNMHQVRHLGKGIGFSSYMLCDLVDVFGLQKLMGHADLQVLRRYLAQTTEDIALAHRIGSPMDTNRL